MVQDSRFMAIPVIASILVLGSFTLNDAFAIEPPPFERMWGFGVDDGTNAFQICTKDTTPCQDGIAGSGDGQFNVPLQVAVDSAGDLYVVDQNNQRVQKFDSNGGFLTTFGVSGTGDGEFIQPYGIAVDSFDNVYVTDSIRNNVQKFDSLANSSFAVSSLEIASSAFGWSIVPSLSITFCVCPSGVSANF